MYPRGMSLLWGIFEGARFKEKGERDNFFSPNLNKLLDSRCSQGRFHRGEPDLQIELLKMKRKASRVYSSSVCLSNENILGEGERTLWMTELTATYTSTPG